jgi:hypothetical protein
MASTSLHTCACACRWHGQQQWTFPSFEAFAGLCPTSRASWQYTQMILIYSVKHKLVSVNCAACWHHEAHVSTPFPPCAHACSAHPRLVLDGEDRDWTGKEVVVKCAQKAGKQQLVNKILGARRFTYSAPPVMVQQAEADLAARGAAHRAQPRPPAGARGFRSAGAAAQPIAPATPAQHAAAAAVAHKGACRAPGTSDAGLLDATPDTLQQQLLQGAGSLADIELRARICSQVFALSDCNGTTSDWPQMQLVPPALTLIIQVVARQERQSATEYAAPLSSADSASRID